MRLKVLSYNIHKGFTPGNVKFVLRNMRKAICDVGADLVFLQEVLGQHDVHAQNVEEWPSESQFEFLAEEVWPHFAYGKNCVYTSGHHGNAILSKYPIRDWCNLDISTNKLESRGMLHATIDIPELESPLHAICVHLNMLARGRRLQLCRICERVREAIPHDQRLIIAGDFNDWKGAASAYMHREARVDEIFQVLHGKHAATYPSMLPLMRLDRIYGRNLRPLHAGILSGGVWRSLSDHCALFGEFELS